MSDQRTWLPKPYGLSKLHTEPRQAVADQKTGAPRGACFLLAGGRLFPVRDIGVAAVAAVGAPQVQVVAPVAAREPVLVSASPRVVRKNGLFEVGAVPVAVAVGTGYQS